MEIRKSKSIGKCFYIDRKNLEDLKKFLEKDFSHTSINAKSLDGAYISFDSFNELFNYKNYDKNKLISLTVNSNSKLNNLEIKFKNPDIFDKNSIEYNLKYINENWGYKFEDDLIDEIKDFIPRFNLIHTFSLTFVPIILVFIYSSIIKISTELNIINPLIETSDKSSNQELILIPLIVLAGFILLGYILEKLKNYIFPKNSIILGKQEKKYSFKQRILQFFFFSIILGLILTLVGNFISKLLLD